jgi:8-oxo-dGTP diphosphatase
VTDPDVTDLRIREAVRAILLTPEQQLLLVRFEFPQKHVWALPGGGIDPGESPEEALRRELLEELGYDLPAIGPHVWNRLHIIPFLDGQWDGQREQVHLVPVGQSFEPRPQLTWQQLNDEYVYELRWWTLDEICSAREVHFVPADLGVLVRRLLDEGPPAQPLDVGV